MSSGATEGAAEWATDHMKAQAVELKAAAGQTIELEVEQTATRIVMRNEYVPSNQVRNMGKTVHDLPAVPAEVGQPKAASAAHRDFEPETPIGRIELVEIEEAPYGTVRATGVHVETGETQGQLKAAHEGQQDGGDECGHVGFQLMKARMSMVELISNRKDPASP